MVMIKPFIMHLYIYIFTYVYIYLHLSRHVSFTKNLSLEIAKVLPDGHGIDV